MNSKNDITMWDVYEKLNLDATKIAFVVISFFYGTGYLIHAITLRNYGVYRLEVVKLQYIEVGVTFAVLTLLITVVPVGCYLAHFRIRKSSKLQHYYAGAIGYMINTYNLFLVIIFFALFITMKEWSSNIIIINSLNIGARLYEIFSCYLIISLFVLVFMPIIERIVTIRMANIRRIYWIFIEPIRFLAVGMAILFDVILIKSFPWIVNLVLRGLTFLGSSLLLFSTIYAILYYMKILGDRKSIHLLATLGTTGIFIVLYMCINAYVFSVIRHIPINRGGKMPITKSYLVTDDNILKNMPFENIICADRIVLGPLYVLEETEDYLHLTKAGYGEWFQDWVQLYSVRKDAIKYIYNERILYGGPRGYGKN